MKLVPGHVVKCSEDYLSVGDVLRHFRMTNTIVLRHDAGIHFITLDGTIENVIHKLKYGLTTWKQ